MNRPVPASRNLPAVSPWRCHSCAALLGLERGGELHIQYKEVEYFIRGDCRHACRRCGATNVRRAPPETTIDARA